MQRVLNCLVPTSQPISPKPILILSSNPVFDPNHSGFRGKCIFLFFQCVLHVPSIYSFLIFKVKKIVGNAKNYKLRLFVSLYVYI
jgi:hypothetical protein